MRQSYFSLPLVFRLLLPLDAEEKWLEIPPTKRRRLLADIQGWKERRSVSELQRLAAVFNKMEVVSAATPPRAVRDAGELSHTPGTLLTGAMHNPGSWECLPASLTNCTNLQLTPQRGSARRRHQEQSAMQLTDAVSTEVVSAATPPRAVRDAGAVGPEPDTEELCLLRSMWAGISNSARKQIRYLLWKRRTADASRAFTASVLRQDKPLPVIHEEVPLHVDHAEQDLFDDRSDDESLDLEVDGYWTPAKIAQRERDGEADWQLLLEMDAQCKVDAASATWSAAASATSSAASEYQRKVEQKQLAARLLTNRFFAHHGFVVGEAKASLVKRRELRVEIRRRHRLNKLKKESEKGRHSRILRGLPRTTLAWQDVACCLCGCLESVQATGEDICCGELLKCDFCGEAAIHSAAGHRLGLCPPSSGTSESARCTSCDEAGRHLTTLGDISRAICSSSSSSISSVFGTLDDERALLRLRRHSFAMSVHAYEALRHEIQSPSKDGV